MPVTTTSQRSAAGSYSAPVVHLHQPQAPPPPPWQGLAIAGGLALQFLLVALIALKTLVPSESSAEKEDLRAAVAELTKTLESREAIAAAQERLQSQRETMDRVVGALRGAGDSFTELQQQVDQAARLEADVAARDEQIRSLQTSVEDVRKRLTSSDHLQDSLKKEIAGLTADNKELAEKLKATQDKLAIYEPKKKPAGKTETAAGTGAISIWWWVGGGILAAVVLVAGVWWMGERMNKTEEEAGEFTAEEPKNPRTEEPTK